MKLQSNNLNKVRGVTICYIEILLQVVCRIWFCIPALHSAGNNICTRVESIQSGINVQQINTGDNLLTRLWPIIILQLMREYIDDSNLDLNYIDLHIFRVIELISQTGNGTAFTHKNKGGKKLQLTSELLDNVYIECNVYIRKWYTLLYHVIKNNRKTLFGGDVGLRDNGSLTTGTIIHVFRAGTECTVIYRLY